MTTENRTDPGNKSAAELEREVEAQRAEVEENLDKLQDRLSPGQMMDQLFDYAKNGNGAEFTRNLGRSMRDNPIPLALMGVGMAWLMLGGSNGSSRRRYKDDDRSDRDWDRDWDDTRDWDDRFSADEDDISGDPVAFGMTPQARGGHAPAESDEKGMMGKAADIANKVGEGASRRGRSWRRGGQRYRDEFGRTVDRYGRRARQGFFNTLEEQPLVLGAIGIAVGAALGAALPATEREDEMMGETRDQLMRDAERTARGQAEKALDMADAGYGAAKEETDRQGLNRETGKSTAGTLKDKANKVAESANTAAERERVKS